MEKKRKTYNFHSKTPQINATVRWNIFWLFLNSQEWIWCFWSFFCAGPICSVCERLKSCSEWRYRFNVVQPIGIFMLIFYKLHFGVIDEMISMLLTTLHLIWYPSIYILSKHNERWMRASILLITCRLDIDFSVPAANSITSSLPCFWQSCFEVLI